MPQPQSLDKAAWDSGKLGLARKNVVYASLPVLSGDFGGGKNGEVPRKSNKTPMKEFNEVSSDGRVRRRINVDALKMHLGLYSSNSEGITRNSPSDVTHPTDSHKEAIIQGRQRSQDIESQRPKTKEAILEANTTILNKYEERYKTKVRFIDITEEGHMGMGNFHVR
jgi:hypothetical protein